MSSSFSATQYDDAFRSQRLQNWTESKQRQQKPALKIRPSSFIADDRGHLLPAAAKRGSAWPDFRGTWDLPARIPVRQVNPTGRSAEGLHRLRSWGFHPQHGGGGQLHKSNSRDSHRLQTCEDVPGDRPPPSTSAEARPASQNHLVSTAQSAPCQDQDQDQDQNQNLQVAAVQTIQAGSELDTEPNPGAKVMQNE